MSQLSRRISFTGSQRGMTTEQQGVLVGLLRQYGHLDWFIHGGCVGADAEAHFLARNQGMKVRVWPSNIIAKSVEFPDADETMPRMPPLDRDTEIVKDGHDHMYACPGERFEHQRSGTWATVRRARKFHVDHSIILPNGHVDTVVYVKPIRVARGLSW